MTEDQKHPRRKVFAGFATGILLTTAASGIEHGRSGGAETIAVSATDFGATGDGATDDTAAIRAAIAALPDGGGTVLLPPGTYLHDEIRLPSNTRLLGAGSDATTLRLRRGASFVGVAISGQVEFDAALSVPQPVLAIKPAGGSLPAGSYTYRVAAARYDVPGANGSGARGEPLGETLASHEVTVTTTGPTSTITVSWPPIDGATGYVVYGRSGAVQQRMAVVTGTAWTDTGVVEPTGLVQDVDASFSRTARSDTGIGLCGLTVDGNRTQQSPGAQFSAVYFNNVDHLHLSDLRIINGAKHGLELQFVRASTLSDVVAEHNGLSGVMCYRGVQGCTFSNIVASGNGRYLRGTGLVFDHGSAGNVINGLVAQGNSLDGLDFSEGSSDNVGCGVNALYNGGSGVTVADGQTGRVTTGNLVSAVCSRNSEHGLCNSGAGEGTFQVTAHYNGASGICIRAGAAQAAVGNLITVNAQHNQLSGVELRQDRNTVIGGNCSTNGTYGVLVADASWCTVRNLDIWDTGRARRTTTTAGVAVSGTGTGNVVEDCLIANSSPATGHGFGVWITAGSQSGTRLRNLRIVNSRAQDISDRGTRTVQSNNDVGG